MYNEARIKRISAADDVDGPGAVFGYQVVSEERTVFTQSDWNFQFQLPTLVSRYTLTLPAGWRARGLLFNHKGVEPTLSGSTYTWELRNLPYIEDEPDSPSVDNLVPRLAVSFLPGDGGARSAMGPSFATWGEVSRWLSTLHDPQAEPDDAIATKARELTASAKTELEKIQAIGRYVQNIQYISIQIGLNRGGGMRPHRASEVFAKNYGDCKDKANLMRAMLRAVHISSSRRHLLGRPHLCPRGVALAAAVQPLHHRRPSSRRDTVAVHRRASQTGPPPHLRRDRRQHARRRPARPRAGELGAHRRGRRRRTPPDAGHAARVEPP